MDNTKITHVSLCAGYGRKHDEMIWFRCGSYHGDGQNIPSGRGVQCYANESTLLKDQIHRLQGDMKKLETYVDHVETELIDLRKRLKALDFESTPDGKALAEVIRIVEAKP